MCGASKPPTPQAPPAPVPARDSAIDGVRSRQTAARRSAATGYESTLAAGPGGDQSPAPASTPVLGA